jgi:glutamate-1-semialdehyde 2,1-aminomutase
MDMTTSTTGALAGNCLGLFKLPDDVAFTISHGLGAKVWSTTGQTYFDYVMGSGPMVLGHAHPRVVAAIAEQAGRGTQFYQVNEKAHELAERICRLVPCAQSVRFCSDGSEATFYALRLARAFTCRSKVLKFDGSYHGHHDYAKQVLHVGHGVNEARSTPDSAGIPEEISKSVIIAPYNDIQRARELLEPISSDVAAIIVEPVQRGFMPAPGFLEGLRELADSSGALLIFDEVVTGFRLAIGGAQELFGVTPDLCALGKILGGGLPVGAVAGRADVLELTVPSRPNDGRSVFMSGTLNGNPLGCAAGLATLDVIEEEQVPAKLHQNGLALREGLISIAQKLSIPFSVIGAPAFQQAVFGEVLVENAADHAKSKLSAARQFGVELVRNGVLVVPGSKFYISLAHEQIIQEAFLEAAYKSMLTVRDHGLLN